jgi:hypothetical protein
MNFSNCNYKMQQDRLLNFRESISDLVNYTVPVQDGGVNGTPWAYNFADAVADVLDKEYL